MKAACYMGQEKLDVLAHEPVQPGPGEVRIRVAYTGICGTDLHVLHGTMDHRVTLPAVLGHEMSGTIEELGEGVEDWAVGDAVTVMPLDWCGKCPACRAGHQHICHQLNFIGIDSTGSMQELWTVPTRVLVRLPEGLALDHAALAEPVAVAVHDVRRADLKAGERAVVIGSGPIGVLVSSVARSLGADVLLLEINEGRRRVAADLGFRAMDPATEDVAAFVDHWTEGAGANVVFDVTGAAGAVALATDLIAVRGRLVIVGIHSQPRPIDLFRVFWREVTILGARVYETEDFRAAVELLATKGAIPVDALITHVRPISEAADAFRALEADGDAMKVLIDCARS
jgi:(R,R)-butanediol dehydrogenase/meso-butanediol dehydrogenase/diacetyl reductase